MHIDFSGDEMDVYNSKIILSGGNNIVEMIFSV